MQRAEQHSVGPLIIFQTTISKLPQEIGILDILELFNSQIT